MDKELVKSIVFEYEIIIEKKDFKKRRTALMGLCKSLNMPIRTDSEHDDGFFVLLPSQPDKQVLFGHLLNALASYCYVHQTAGRLVTKMMLGGYDAALHHLYK